jgi:hypothetical protein
MEKYGYKNISNRDEFQKSTAEDRGINYGPSDNSHFTEGGFIDFSKQGDWGMPGETRYFVKGFDSLSNASDNVSKAVMGERKPSGYVGW